MYKVFIGRVRLYCAVSLVTTRKSKELIYIQTLAYYVPYMFLVNNFKSTNLSKDILFTIISFISSVELHLLQYIRWLQTLVRSVFHCGHS